MSVYYEERHDSFMLPQSHDQCNGSQRNPVSVRSSLFKFQSICKCSASPLKCGLMHLVRG